jgi:hypothetical protein
VSEANFDIFENFASDVQLDIATVLEMPDEGALLSTEVEEESQPKGGEIFLKKQSSTVDENENVNVLQESGSVEDAPQDDEKEQMKRYNFFVREYKAASAADDLDGQIKALQSALEIRPNHEKLTRKLEKLNKEKAESINKELKLLTRQHSKNEKEKVPSIKVDGFKHRPGQSSYQVFFKFKLNFFFFVLIFFFSSWRESLSFRLKCLKSCSSISEKVFVGCGSCIGTKMEGC